MKFLDYKPVTVSTSHACLVDSEDVLGDVSNVDITHQVA